MEKTEAIYHTTYKVGFLGRIAKIEVNVPWFDGKPWVKVNIKVGKNALNEDVLKKYWEYSQEREKNIQYEENIDPKEVKKTLKRVEAIYRKIIEGLIDSYEKIKDHYGGDIEYNVEIKSENKELEKIIEKRLKAAKIESEGTPLTDYNPHKGIIPKIAGAASVFVGLYNFYAENVPALLYTAVSNLNALDSLQFYRAVVPMLLGFWLLREGRYRAKEEWRKKRDFVLGEIGKRIK